MMRAPIRAILLAFVVLCSAASMAKAQDRELDAVYLIREDGERLIVEAGDRPAAVIVAGGPDRLRLERTGVVILPDRDPSGRVNGFTLDAGRVRGLLFTRR
ncbi:MAG: hypothetical protein ACRD2N_14275 [Vicinamibacterales bacterium]